MKRASILFLTAILLFSVILNGLAQHMHDFDSLYDNDKAFKQKIKSSQGNFSLFENEEVMKITIESDFKHLVKTKYKDEEQPALLSYHVSDSVVIVRHIKISPRGNMRKSTCFFPPLKLNFLKSEVVLDDLKEFDKMKMVMDCKRGELYEQYLLSEYFAYKIQNIITDYSYRVRLMQVTYIDTSDKYKIAVKYAFLIENKEQMSERLNTMPIDNKNVRDNLTDLPTLAKAYLFQYLIGNTDWSIPARHNLQLLKSKDPTLIKPYVVPYDFDYAGIVNANYAVPDENLGTSSVTERVYRGVCIPESEIKNAAKHFIDQKEKIYALYENTDLLSKSNKRFTVDYIDRFFAIIEHENSLKRYMLDACR